MHISCRLALTIGLAHATLSAYAADLPSVTISGFGTVALTKTSTDEAEFFRLNQEGAGAKSMPTTGVDSNFGVQAVARLSDRLSVTAQALVHKDGPDRFRGELAWAFLKYKVSDEVSVRAGRTTPPIYMISDSRHIGYANLMIRPVAEIYNLVPIGSIDGVDITYQRSIGETVVTAQAAAGRANYHRSLGYAVEFQPIVVLQVTATHGPYTVRLAHASADFSLKNQSLDGLLSGLRAAGAPQIADALKGTDVRGKFTGLGFDMDRDNVLAQAEFAKKKIGSRVTPDLTAWYALLGYRFGAITPYYFHSNVRQDSQRSFNLVPTGARQAGLLAGANAQLKGTEQTANGIGVRWDFARSAALKVQLDRVTPVAGKGISLNTAATHQGAVNVLAAGVDFVF
jgi:hypothetical protein